MNSYVLSLVSILIFLVTINNAFVFNLQSFARIRNSKNQNGFKMMATLHGENFKFMPLSKLSRDEYFPRVIQIGGVYPGVTLDEYYAPKSSKEVSPSMWSYEFPDPDGPQLGSVSVPGSDVIYDCIDPVALISSTDQLGIKSKDGPSEVLVIIDREDRDFFVDSFYAVENSDGNIEITSLTDSEGYNIIGKVVVCFLPTPPAKKQSSGFMEDEDLDF